MILEILLTIFLVLLNAFFVAAEFAIVKVRYSQIELKAREGNRIARQSKKIIDKLDTYLSATQLGITLASLGLGWIGEPVFAKIISAIVHLSNAKLTDDQIHQIAFPVGFIVITILHIVFGELAPKSIAIRKAEKTTLFVSLPLNVFYVIFRPFIWLMNIFSSGFLKLIGIQPAGELDIHTSDELRLLVKQSREGGEIEAENYEIIKNAFEFTDQSAKEIMVPRQDVFAVDISDDFNANVKKIMENGYSRVPVFKDNLDNLVGVVHIKDLMKRFYSQTPFTFGEVMHPVFYVVEAKKISEVLKEFQAKHIHMAVVIDEYGGMEGIITLEDILEELVGEIQDEDDNERPIVEKLEDGSYLIQSTQPLSDINEYLPFQIPEDPDYNSLSGYILFMINRIPRQGELIKIKDLEITINRISHRTIQVVQVRHIPTPIEPAAD
jgi:CBS domain containing-hemolysin-like protein